MDLDLRKLRYFVAVAEHLNFGRAAEDLHIAQPVLSRQIRALEQELKAGLFVRGPRGTELTAAGQVLLEDARRLLPAADAARRRVLDAAASRTTFTVGFAPGLIVTDVVREFGRRRPELAVEVFRTSWYDQTTVIFDGQVDVGYLRRPFDPQGLGIEPLLAEPRVVSLPVSHRLAGKESVSVTDLAGEHLLQDPEVVPEWRDIATELRGAGAAPGGPAAAHRGGEARARRDRERRRGAAGVDGGVLHQARRHLRPGGRHRPVAGLPGLGRPAAQCPDPGVRRARARPGRRGTA